MYFIRTSLVNVTPCSLPLKQLIWHLFSGSKCSTVLSIIFPTAAEGSPPGAGVSSGILWARHPLKMGSSALASPERKTLSWLWRTAGGPLPPTGVLHQILLCRARLHWPIWCGRAGEEHHPTPCGSLQLHDGSVGLSTLTWLKTCSPGWEKRISTLKLCVKALGREKMIWFHSFSNLRDYLESKI